MPELTENQIADLRALKGHCRSLGADLVIIGAIAYQVHFPREDRHTGDIDFAVALDLDEFAELERRLLADKCIRFASREHGWRSPRGTILDLLPAGPKLRAAKQVIWPASQFRMSLVGFDHVFETAQPVPFAPDLTLKVISSTTLMLLKIVAYMDDQQRRAKDLEDIRGLLAEYEADSERVFSDIVIDAELEDYGLAPAFLMGLDLRALCNDEEVQIVHSFLETMNEDNPTWMTFVRARGVGDHVEEDARSQALGGFSTRIRSPCVTDVGRLTRASPKNHVDLPSRPEGCRKTHDSTRMVKKLERAEKARRPAFAVPRCVVSLSQVSPG